MFRIVRTDSQNSDFSLLTNNLDCYLSQIHTDEHEDCKPHNNIETIKYVVLIYDQDQNVVACGAIREYALGVMEIKRMFVDPSARKKGIAKLIINELEMWTKDLGASKCILETGNKMEDAISLYQRCGYHQIANYQPYENSINSVCFEKTIG